MMVFSSVTVNAFGFIKTVMGHGATARTYPCGDMESGVKRLKTATPEEMVLCESVTGIYTAHHTLSQNDMQIVFILP